MNRRTFLQTISAGTVAALLPRRMAWAADTAGAGDLRFVYYTDIHARLEWDTPLALRQAADLINAQRTDVVLCGGDLITEGYESSSAFVAPRWDAYFEHLHHRIDAPVHAIIGNHDLVGVEPRDGSAPADDPKSEFRTRLKLDRTYRSFDFGGYHVVLLDPLEVTKDELKYRGFVDEAQLVWLREDLATLDARTPILLATHMPLMTGFYQATQGATSAAPANRVVVNSRDVLAAFEGRNLVLVLQGHLHVSEWLRWRDTTFITGGAVCGKWWRGEWHGTREGLGVVEISDGRVEWKYLDLGWTARRPTGV